MFALIITICIVSLISETSCQLPSYHRLTPRHGTNDGVSSNNFTCPGNGAITGINYFFSGYDINSLEFICSSPAGITSFGPYGPQAGFKKGAVLCPPGQYVSSLYGGAIAFVTNIKVRCRPITANLRGNGTNAGLIGYQSSAPAFDDIAYSIGARPIGVIIWTSSKVESIQINYANTPVELCTVNCSVYQEESTPLYGTGNGAYQKLSVFRCPNGGEITEIKTSVFVSEVRALQFGCTSGVGTKMSETFGQEMPKQVAGIKCPPGMIVGSFHGKYGASINALGIRCVVYGSTVDYPKYDAQGGTAGIAFDDKKYSLKGLRPVQIIVYHSSNGISGIQVKYGNAKVAANCKVTRIEVIDNSVQATSDGFEVIGVATELSCVTRTQMLKLDSTRARKDDVTVEVSNGGDINWSREVSVSAKTGVDLFGNKAEITIAAAGRAGGASKWSTANSNSSSISTSQFAGTEITYKSPGACIIIGYVDRYKIDRNNVNVLYHYQCESGEMTPELGNIRLKSITYGNSHFYDYQMRLTGENQCTSGLRACLQTLNAAHVVVDDTELLNQFTACFPAGSGQIH